MRKWRMVLTLWWFAGSNETAYRVRPLEIAKCLSEGIYMIQALA